MTVHQIRPDLAEAFDAAGPAQLSDDDLALLFADEHAKNLRYVADWSQWYMWDGQVWRRDDKLRVFNLARGILRGEAEATPEKAKALKSNHTIAAVVSLSRCDSKLAAVIGQWDTHPFLLNTPDGIIDLADGTMLGNVTRLEFYMTKLTAVSPANTGCPRFMQFLDEVTGGDEALVSFLQRVFGYCLTGSTREHALFFFYGTGSNGKSVLINIVNYILADYQRTAPMETFTVTHSDRHPTELAGLQGRRLVTATETEEGRRWADAKVKQLTGGDMISARYMRQDFFEYAPQFKLVIAGNHKPGLRSVDEATRRRFNLIPFTVTFPEDQRDPQLLDKLKIEAPGILQWMIDGALAWQEQGLVAPEVVTAATREYLASEDAIAGWIEDCCVLDPDKFESTGLLYASWRKWAQLSGERRLDNMTSFGRALDSRGVEAGKKSGIRVRRGIELTDEARSEAEDVIKPKSWTD